MSSPQGLPPHRVPGLRRWPRSLPSGARPPPAASLAGGPGSAPCTQSHRGWWGRATPGLFASSTSALAGRAPVFFYKEPVCGCDSAGRCSGTAELWEGSSRVGTQCWETLEALEAGVAREWLQLGIVEPFWLGKTVGIMESSRGSGPAMLVQRPRLRGCGSARKAGPIPGGSCKTPRGGWLGAWPGKGSACVPKDGDLALGLHWWDGVCLDAHPPAQPPLGSSGSPRAPGAAQHPGAAPPSLRTPPAGPCSRRRDGDLGAAQRASPLLQRLPGAGGGSLAGVGAWPRASPGLACLSLLPALPLPRYEPSEPLPCCAPSLPQARGAGGDRRARAAGLGEGVDTFLAE